MPQDEQTLGPEPIWIEVDPSARAQTVEGWGTSLAWWGNVLGSWSEERQQEIVDKLYSAERGISLSIARYNIGGTRDEDDPYLDYGKAILSYQNEEGLWEWSRDASQRAILQKIQATAEHPIFEAFSNCPPWWMTCSYDRARPDSAAGCTTGGPDGGDNLRSGFEKTFAQYLVNVLLHFREEWGIEFRTLAPFNEPVAGWWKYRITRQEGAQILPAQQERVIRELSEALRSAGLHRTNLSASDESYVEMALATWEAFASETKALIAQVNTHTYNDLSYDPTAFLEAVKTDGKKLWMSEFGFENGEHPTLNPYSMSGAIRLAQGVTKDLKTMQAEAWVYWQAVESDASTWGLIFAPFEHNPDESYALYKQYYALGNYSRFIRPGSIMAANSGAKSLAAISPSSEQLVIVTYNDSDTEDMNCRYRLQDSFSSAASLTIRVYRTSATENLVELPSLVLTNGEFADQAPPCSITTYVIERAGLQASV